MSTDVGFQIYKSKERGEKKGRDRFEREKK